jgi:hypothetical protein
LQFLKLLDIKLSDDVHGMDEEDLSRPATRPTAAMGREPARRCSFSSPQGTAMTSWTAEHGHGEQARS